MHTTTLTFVLMAWDRLRFIRHPTKARMPAFVCIIGTWLASVCFVLPYPIYIIYIDLGVSTRDSLIARIIILLFHCPRNKTITAQINIYTIYCL
jgi:hypothetical protein